MAAGGEATPGPAAGPGPDLRERIRAHYDRLSSLYVLFWGEHLHHGYWEGDESRAEAQEKLVRLLAERAGIPRGARVLDVGCGVGGSARWLAANLGCSVVGITLSHKQARMGAEACPGDEARARANRLAGSPAGRTWYLQADAADLPVRDASLDAVWILECYEHIEDKRGVLRGLARALRPGGVLALTGWFRGEDVPDEIAERDLRPVMEGMLLPPLATLEESARWAEEAGFAVRETADLTSHVARTWDACIEIAATPLARLVLPTLDPDSRRFVAAFDAMKRAYASGALRYGLIAGRLR